MQDKFVGPVLRKIRKQKNMTLQYVAAGIMDASHLAKVEKGLITTNSENFLALLSKLNVSQEEFLLSCEEEPFLKRQLTVDFSRYFTQGDDEALKRLELKVRKLVQENSDESYLHLQELCEAGWLFLKSQHDFRSIKGKGQTIKIYLYNTEVWSQYEYVLVTNCLFLFETREIYFFSKKANRLFQSIKDNQTKFILSSLLYNASVILLEKGEIKEALEISNYAIEVASKNFLGFQLLCSQVIHRVCLSLIEKKQDQKLEAYLQAVQLVAPVNFYQQLVEIVQSYLPQQS
jgi:Rgg/GadR/MutR family transcriptional activator